MYLQGALATANANTVYLQGALNTANTIKANVSGYASNVIVYANQTGYLSNSGTYYVSSNNTLITTGNVAVSGIISIQKGIIYTANIYPGTQTAITIDFANNTLVRAQTSSALTMSFTNFISGKVVDAWITNIAATSQSFTHGVSSNNSTVGATTYSIPTNSTIYVKYWCMDGTLGNTFCAITHQ